PSGNRFKQTRTSLKVAFHFLTGGNKKFDVGSQVIQQASESNSKNAQPTENATTCDSNSDPSKVAAVTEGLKAKWSTDEYARTNFSTKTLLQFQHFMNENHEAAKAIKDKPVLMIQGWEDNLVKWQGTLELWNELSTEDKQIELIPKAKHL